MTANGANPFRISGTVVGEYFTDRAIEVKRIAAALSEPQAKLLVYGPRRMGKSSAIESAVRRLRRRGSPAVVVDLSTATALADVASRILQAAAGQLPSSWRDVVGDIVRHLRVGVTVVPDPATGHPTLFLDVGHRKAPLEEQRLTLAEALDAIDRLAADRERTIGVVLDEFQEIHRFGGEEAEWHLRGVIQRHKNVSYVLAGSRESLIGAMVQKNRASGRRVVELARSRTRDVIQLARAAFEIGRARGKLGASDVEEALDRVVDEEDEMLRAEWERRTALQQNVLRALAAREQKLFSESTRDRYGLRGSAYVAGALDGLIDADLVVKRADGEYEFDSPFMQRWVARHTLPDVGVLDVGLEPS
jgi:hypothetical protein